MLVFGNLNFDFESIKKALNDKTIELNSEYLALYLYEQNDYASYSMINNKGKEIQGKLKIDLFTYYSLSAFEAMGKFYGLPKVKEQFDKSDLSWFDNNSSFPFEKMKKIGDEYGVKKYPAIILINPNATDVNSNNSYHIIEIDKNRFMIPECNDFSLVIEKEADILYRYFFEPFISITADFYDDNNLFLDLKRKLNFNNLYKKISNEIKIESKFYKEDSKDNNIYNLKIYIQQQDRKCISRNGEKFDSMDTFTYNSLSIYSDAYSRRYSKGIGFTRDELLCLALYLQFSNAEFTKLIELYKKAFKIEYSNLNKYETRDHLFLELMENHRSYNFSEINEELSKKGLSKIIIMR